MYDLLTIVLRGLGLGAIYSLVAISLVVVYSSSNIVNFAQGTLFILGGLAASLFAAGVIPPAWYWFACLLVTGALIGLLSFVQGWITLLPAKSTIAHSWMITTMSVSIIIGALLLMFRGPWAQVTPAPFKSIEIFSIPLPSAYIIAALLSLILYVALHLFLTRNFIGLAISALSQDVDAARLAGLRAHRLQLLAFALSGVIIGLAGYAVAPMLVITPDTGIKYLMGGFISAVIGGIGSNIGALLGGPIVGVITMLAIYEFGGELQNVVTVLLLAAVLLVRPQGIFGRRAARRV